MSCRYHFSVDKIWTQFFRQKILIEKWNSGQWAVAILQNLWKRRFGIKSNKIQNHPTQLYCLNKSLIWKKSFQIKLSTRWVFVPRPTALKRRKIVNAKIHRFGRRESLCFVEWIVNLLVDFSQFSDENIVPVISAKQSVQLC